MVIFGLNIKSTLCLSLELLLLFLTYLFHLEILLYKVLFFWISEPYWLDLVLTENYDHMLFILLATIHNLPKSPDACYALSFEWLAVHAVCLLFDCVWMNDLGLLWCLLVQLWCCCCWLDYWVWIEWMPCVCNWLSKMPHFMDFAKMLLQWINRFWWLLTPVRISYCL